MTGRMSPETEARLTEAVAAIADLAGAGEDPTAATVKVARAFSLLPAQISLVAAAYNTGAAAAHRKSAGSLLERADEIPLVDGLKAVNLSYPPTKQASVQAVRTRFLGRPGGHGTVSPGAGGEATFSLFGSAEKAAAVEPSTGEEIAALRKEAEETRHKAEKAYSSMATKLAELAQYFRRSPTVGFQDAWSEAVCRHGKKAAAVFATVQTMYPEVIRAEVPRPAYVRYDQPPHSIVGDCLKLASECNELVDRSGDLFAAVAALTPPDEKDVSPLLRKSAAQSVNPLPPKPTPSGGGGAGGKPSGGKPPTPGGGKPPVPGTGSGAGKPAPGGGAGPTAAGLTLGALALDPARKMLSSLSGPSPEDVEKHRQSVLRAVVDPYQMADERAGQAQLMLTDLIAGDPVIGSHPPSKVLAHYNELAQLAPRLMSGQAAARAVLRQRLESGAGGIDPYQIEQLLKAENEIRKRDDPAYGKGLLDL